MPDPDSLTLPDSWPAWTDDATPVTIMVWLALVQESPQTSADLAESLPFSRDGIRNGLEWLRERDLVERHVDTADARMYRYHLSD